MSIPGFVLSAAQSGSGKTLIATALMKIFKDKKKKVRPFKVGPDYLDPMYHSKFSGFVSRNLDSFLLKHDVLKYLYNKSAQTGDIAVVEGVMGLFDGLGGNSSVASTSEVAKILGLPVILLINAEGISHSIAPIIQGFEKFDPDVNIAGVILNKVKSNSHYTILKQVIEEYSRIKPLGYIPFVPEATLSSRHLGLLPQNEIEDLERKIEIIASRMLETLEMDAILNIATTNIEHYNCYEINLPKDRFDGIRIGIAKDVAFNFYYQDNLDLLAYLGAELIEFSPIGDEKLPNVDGIILGGGYPEVYANELSQNQCFINDLNDKISNGMPTYAECGGMMYLTQSLIDSNNNEFRMAGILEGIAKMTSKLQKFGYVHVTANCDNILLRLGEKLPAHEFHYSEIDGNEGMADAFKIEKAANSIRKPWSGGYSNNNVLAAYPHIHFWSNPKVAERFLETCKNAKDERGGK